MLPIYNQVLLAGRAGHQPILIHSTDDSTRATLRLYQNLPSETGKQSAQVHHLVAWDSVAQQMAARVHRGDRLLVQGRLRYRRFVSQGVTHLRAEIHVSHFDLLIVRKTERASQAIRPAEKSEVDE